MGVPQGSILSVILFSMKINSIAQCLKPGVDCSFSDLLQSIQHEHNRTSAAALREYTAMGFDSHRQRLSVCISAFRCIVFFWDKSPIPVVEETTFLGVSLTGSYPLLLISNMLTRKL